MQKIGFARIMISKPDIILLDESTSNLDKESKEIVFKKLMENHSTVINSTHDPEDLILLITIFKLKLWMKKDV